MAYGEKDPRLDKTTAWVVSAIIIALIVAMSWAFSNYRYAQETNRKAIEAGYCETPNLNAAGQQIGGYHWEKCQ